MSNIDYAWLFDHSPQCAILHDPHSGVVIAANRAAAHMLDYSRDEMRGMSLLKIMAGSGQYRSERAIERLMAAVDKGVEAAEWRLIRRDGSEVPIDATAIPLHDQGGRLLVLVQMRDISEELEAQRREERYRRLLADSFGGTMIVGQKGRVRYVAPSVTRLLGYAEAELVGTDFRRLVHPRDRARIRHRIQAIAPGDTGLHEVEYRVLHADGQYRYQEAGLRNLQDDIDVGGLLVSFRDVTARVLAEQETRREREELQALLRFRTMAELGSAIAHELNQPVAAIRNYAVGCLSMMGEDDRVGEIGWAVQQIELEAERAARIMRSIRNFATEGRTERRMHVISDIFSDVEELLQVRARENRVELHFVVRPARLRIWCDKTLTEQVLVNLVLNALQAFQDDERTPRRVDISAAVHDANLVEFIVRDTGAGMSGQQLAALFQERRSTRESFGLGLILSRSIITNHGGDIEARSVPGEGTAIHFTLRRRKGNEFE